MSSKNPDYSPSANASAMDRRSFVKAASTAGLGIALGSSPARSAPTASRVPRRRRYAIVGCGNRHHMYHRAILGSHKDHAELVGLCDINPGRLELSRRKAEAAGARVPGYHASDFDRMIREAKPDVIIVTTVDSTHDDYIVPALEAGCDVITEKPMTTTAEKCQRILDAKARTGRNIRVTFNYRYSPPRTQVKELLMNGEIGDVLSVDFHWMLNTIHGADYFRRWHSQKKFSGGLMVHKATHHFDLINWWLGSDPVTVTAVGKRDFYTPKMAKRMGLKSHHERCLTCPEKKRCGFFLDLTAFRGLRELYLDQEHHDGYYRDRCVWRPDIDIEDTMNVVVKYASDATLSYSLNTFNAWEGYQVAFNGTKGRLEHSIVEKIYMSGTDAVQGGIAKGGIQTRVIPLRGPAIEHEPWSGAGGHGGGDPVLLDDIFLENPPPDKYGRNSDERGGAASILIGVAANDAFATGQPVNLRDLVTGWRSPDYAPMPDHEHSIPMPLPVT